VSNFLIAIIRTMIPVLVGHVIAWFVSIGVALPPDVEAGLALSLGTLLASLYYIGVAWLERKWPWFGWLLGVARNPVYAPVSPTGKTE
jgi:hypothetical protein